VPDDHGPGEVLTEREGAILVITLNRPKARNAVNGALARGMAAALDELDADATLSVGVLTGAGSSFSAGMDLKAFLTGDNPTVAGRGFAAITLAPPAKPMIAAVEGYALAGGCEIALACDLIVASREARFGLPETTRGLVAGAGGLLRLPQRIPPAIAMEYALTSPPRTPTGGAWSTGSPSPATRWRERWSWRVRSPRTVRSRYGPPRRSSRPHRTGPPTSAGGARPRSCVPS
jgi:enoyl-CoA hydratase/carnithine racemase